jgi:hypothetical protein
MRRHVAPGIALAIAGGLLVLLGGWLGLDLDSVALLGAALGGALALVPDRAPLAKLAGFAVGFVLAWVGYGVRAATLPDTDEGRAVAVVLVLIACMVVAAVAQGRLPLWSLLIGVAAMVGSYEEAYAASPSQFLDTSPSAATTVLLAAAFGYVAAALLGEAIRDDRRREAVEESGAGDDLDRRDESVVA